MRSDSLLYWRNMRQVPSLFSDCRLERRGGFWQTIGSFSKEFSRKSRVPNIVSIKGDKIGVGDSSSLEVCITPVN